MNNVDGSLSFKADLNNDDFRRKIAQTEAQIRGLADNTVQQTSKMDSAFRNLAALAGGVFAFAGANQFVSDVIRVRGEFQQLEIAFGTMLRSKERADKLMAEAIELAAKTPFTLQDVASGAKQLLAYGASAEGVAKEIQMIGDIASGVGAPLNDIIYLYGTLRAQGRATTIDIRQFAGRGIPIYEELSKVVGVSTKELKDWIENGKIGFAEIEKAFQNMTTEGGMFFNLMEAQSKSVTGRISNLQDAWSRMLNEIGKSNEGAIYGSVSLLNSLVENYKEVGKILAELVIVYGVYRAALIANSAILKVEAAMTVQSALAKMEFGAATKGATFWQTAMMMATGKLNAAQKALNATMLGNPYVAIAAALVAAVSAIYMFADGVTNLEVSAEKFNEELLTEQTNLNAVFSMLQNTEKGTKSHSEAMKSANEILSKYNLSLLTENSNLQDITASYNQATEAMMRSIALTNKEAEIKEKMGNISKEYQKWYSDLIDDINDAGKGAATNSIVSLLNEVVGQNVKMFTGNLIDANNAEKSGKIIRDLAKQTGLNFQEIERYGKAYAKYIDDQNTAIKNISQYYDPIINQTNVAKDSIEGLYAALAKADTKEERNSILNQIKTLGEKNGISKDAINSVAKLNDRLAELKKEQAAASDSKDKWDNYQKQIDAVDAKIKSITGTKVKIEPMGSVSYWEDVKQKAEAALRSLTPQDKDLETKTQKYIADIERAQTEIDRLEFSTKPFEDQLAYRKNQYELYFRWVEFMGQQAADAQFKDLLTQGDTYAAYLEKQKTTLESIKDKTPAQQEQLFELKIEIESLQSPEAILDAFRLSLDKTKKEAGNLTEFLTRLNQAQNELINDFSPSALAKKDELATQIRNTQEALQSQYDQMLSELDLFYKEYTAIKRTSSQKISDIATQVDQGVITPEQGVIEMQVVYTGEKNAIDKVQTDIDNRLKSFTKFTGSLSDIGKAQLDVLVRNIEQIINIPELDQVRTQVLNQIKAAREAQADQSAAGAQNYVKAIESLSGSLISAGGDAAELGKKISGTLQNVNSLTEGQKQVKIDLATNTDEALLQLNQIIQAISEIKGVQIDVMPGTGIENIQKQIQVIRQALDESFNIQISGDVSDTAGQIEAIKSAIKDKLQISIDPEKATADLSALLLAAQQLLSAGVQLPVTIDTGQALDDLLQKYQSYSDKRKAIEKGYVADIRTLESAYNLTTDEAKKQQIAASIEERKKAFNEELATLSEGLISQQDYYKTIMELGRAALVEEISNLKKKAEAIRATYGEASAEYKAYTDAIEKAEAVVLSSDMEKVAFYSQLATEAISVFADELTDAQSSAIELISELGNLAIAMASGDPISMLKSALSLNKQIINVISKNVKSNDLKTLLAWSYGGPLGLFNLNKINAKEAAAQRAELQKQIIGNIELNRYYRERLLSQLDINEATYVGIYQQLGAYQSVLDQTTSAYESAFKELNNIIGGNYEQMLARYLRGDLSESEAALFKQVQALKKEMEDLGISVDETRDKITAMFAGTNADSLANSLVSAFEQGQTAMSDFSQSFDDIIQQAVYSVMKAQLIMPLVEDFISNFLAPYIQLATNNANPNALYQISPELLATTLGNVRGKWDEINGNIQEYLSIIEESMGLDLTGGASVNSMQGAIKGITEESASLIAGQFNAMRIIQFGILDSVNKSLTHLAQIQFNTMVSATELKKLNRKFSGNSATGREYGG